MLLKSIEDLKNIPINTTLYYSTSSYSLIRTIVYRGISSNKGFLTSQKIDSPVNQWHFLPDWYFATKKESLGPFHRKVIKIQKVLNEYKQLLEETLNDS